MDSFDGIRGLGLTGFFCFYFRLGFKFSGFGRRYCDKYYFGFGVFGGVVGRVRFFRL